MPGSASPKSLPSETFETASGVPAGAVVANGAGLLAAWTAAGSLGLMAPALQTALTWLGLSAALVAVWPFRLAAPGATSLLRLDLMAWTLIGALLVALASQAILPAFGPLLGIVLVLAALAVTQSGPAARVLRVTALAVAGFTLYRFVYSAVPVVWIVADWLAQALALLTRAVTGRPLSVGATFAGVDFLVLMSGFCAGWLLSTPRPRLARAAIVAAGILVGHLVFLSLLTWAPEMAAALPTAPVPAPADREQAPIWFWGDALRGLIPWLLPMGAGLFHALLAAWVLRWSAWQDEPAAAPAARAGSFGHGALAPAALALLVPVAALLAPFRSDLAGRTIAVYDRGHFDWGRPEHGRYGDAAAGGLGLLPDLVASLHGRLIRLADLAHKDLDRADVLMLIHPRAGWSKEQLQRLWDYVRRGGALLVVAENRTAEEALDSPYDEILAPTAMRVRYDCAFKATRNWEGALETSGVTAAAQNGLDPYRFETGSSLAIGLGAAPLVVGRFGWSEPGSDALPTGSAAYDSGERLGDLVLAAQQRIGRGRVVVLGDITPVTNLGLPSSYPFVGRLIGWLASRGSDPQGWPRQALALLAAAGLVTVILRGAAPGRLALAAVALTLSMAGCQAANARFSAVVPDGRPADGSPPPVRLAYIGASHLEDHAGCRWTDPGINGLALTLARNGYFPLLLPRLDAARLDRVDLLVSIAPARAFSAPQRGLMRRFVERGGVWICMAGAEHAEAAAPLLAEFGLRVPPCPLGPEREGKEPEPLGCAYAKYYEDDRGRAEMLLHDAWPVECDEPDGAVLVKSNEGWPVVIARPVHRGLVALIGDSRFAWNKNLEQADGTPIYGGHHNADFWRWFIPRLTGHGAWIPPVAKSREAAEAAPASKPSAAKAESEVRP